MREYYFGTIGSLFGVTGLVLLTALSFVVGDTAKFIGLIWPLYVTLVLIVIIGLRLRVAARQAVRKDDD